MMLSVPKAIAWLGMILAGVLIVVILFEGGGDQNYVVYARFADADDLLPDNFVKIDGIQAGVIKAVTLNKAESQVIVKMGLNSDAAPIGPGATAAIRPVNLLGEKYLDLSPGETSHPLPSGSTIPIDRTSDPVELDDVFNTLDPDTLASLQILVNEAGVAMAGRGADFMQTLRDLPPTLGSARQVVSQIAQQNKSLRTAILDGNATLASIDSRKRDLQGLITSGKGALDAINAARGNLGRTISSAPGGLAQLRTSLLSLEDAADALTPAAADLEQTTPALGQTLARLPKFATEADGALAEAKAVSPDLARLGTESAPILKEMRPTTAELASFSTTAEPLLNALDQQNGLNDVLGFANGWADVTENGDSLGHVFRLRFSLDPAALTDALDEYEALHGLRRARHPLHAGTRSSAPALTLPTTTSTSHLGSTLHGVTKKVQQTVGGAVNSVGTATGQPATATRQLLNFLLGP